MSQHKVFQILFYSLLLSQITACSVELQDKEQPDSQLKVQSQGLFPLFPMEGPHYRIDVGVQPNSYQLKILPPEGTSQTERIELSQTEAKKQWSLGFEFTDLNVKPGHRYEYRFLMATAKEISRVQVQIPIDLAINSKVDFRKADMGAGTDLLRKYRRVFLGPEAKLLMFTQNIEIQAEQLMAEPGARLINFPKEQKTPALDYKGQSGGDITLKVGEAHGILRVEMRGENGGNGSPGEAFKDRAASGPNAAIQSVKHCDHIGRGGPGTPGSKGRTGQKGGAGGHTGSFEFVSDNRSDFKIDRVQEGGRAGESGQGGPGQLGGVGGVSEVRRWVQTTTNDIGPGSTRMKETFSCPRIANGENGKDGVTGDKGPPGDEGREAMFCERAFAESCAR